MRYEHIYKNFAWDLPDRFNFATDVIDKFADACPEKTALVRVSETGQSQTLTRADISQRSQRAANALSTAGVARGDTVLLIVGKSISWWETMTACLRAGFVAAPATTQLSAKDIALRIKASQAVAAIADAENADKIDRIATSCPSLKVKLVIESERHGWISYDKVLASAKEKHVAESTQCVEGSICFFTSGTTGLPKMVVHSHGYALAHSVTGKYWLGVGEDDLHWNIADTGWAKAAWSSYFGPWSQGAAIFVHDARIFDARRVLTILDEYPITSLCCAPTAYRMLVQEDLSKFKFSALRSCVSAGEPLNAEVIHSWRAATGVTIRDGYGQSESTILCGTFPAMEAKAGSMGRPAPGVELANLDHDGNVLPPGQEGDLAVRTSPVRPLGLFEGYGCAGGKRDTSSFRGEWYLTGDRAYCDQDGYFWFVGRSDDVIISAGYRIGPFEVESALLEHYAVAESAVVGSPDPVRGFVVKAFVVLNAAFKPSSELVAELQSHVKTVTAPYKYPRKIEFVSELPKTVSGKIRRVDLRNAELQRTMT